MRDESRERVWTGETHIPELAFQFTVLVLFERFHSGILLCAIDVACGTVIPLKLTLETDTRSLTMGFHRRKGGDLYASGCVLWHGPSCS